MPPPSFSRRRRRGRLTPNGARTTLIQGPIGSIDYAEDAKRIFGSSLGQSAGIAIRQNGMVFVAQVGTTPDDVFTRKEGKALKASSFGVLTPGGFPGGASPDFSAAGGPIEFGFVRGNSTGAGGPGYTLIAAIDNWFVRVNPPCTQPSDCDDADPCTTDACAAGACTFTPIPCDDGDGCTVDTCVGGTCQSTARSCDDGVDCTADSCTGGACQNTVRVDLRACSTRSCRSCRPSDSGLRRRDAREEDRQEAREEGQEARAAGQSGRRDEEALIAKLIGRRTGSGPGRDILSGAVADGHAGLRAGLSSSTISANAWQESRAEQRRRSAVGIRSRPRSPCPWRRSGSATVARRVACATVTAARHDSAIAQQDSKKCPDLPVPRRKIARL